MKKVKISLLTLVMILISSAIIGCGSKEPEAEETKVKVENTENQGNDETQASTDNETVDDKEDESTEETLDDESISREAESGSEEETTPMESDSSANEETSTKEQATTTPQQTTTQPVTTATPTTSTTAETVTTPAATEQTTTQPTVTETTTTDYGAIIDTARDGDYLDKYSRRGIDRSLYPTAENIINSILTRSMSEVQRVRAIHDWLVKNVNYDYDTAANIGNVTGYESAFTAEGALVNKLAVCEGYSEAFLLLCWTAGIDARIIEGTGNGGAHEWNVVEIADKWYQIDVTFDDPLINNTIDTTGGNLAYDYFLLTTNDMCADHTITACYNDTLPDCTSTDYYEYAKQCTLETKLGGTPYVIISNYDQAKTAVASYNYQGIKDFAFVYAEDSLDVNILYQTVCDVTVNNLSYYGGGTTVSASGSYMNTNGYTIAFVNLTIS